MNLYTQGFLHKLFGAHDIRGRGSDVPGCAHADPFFLCDAVRLPRHAKPPFCAHPHSGAGVISLLFRAACTVRPWDNVQGAEAEPLRAGGIYHVDTGAGAPPSKFARIVGSDAASGSMGSSWTQPAPVST